MLSLKKKKIVIEAVTHAGSALDDDENSLRTDRKKVMRRSGRALVHTVQGHRRAASIVRSTPPRSPRKLCAALLNAPNPEWEMGQSMEPNICKQAQCGAMVRQGVPLL